MADEPTTSGGWLPPRAPGGDAPPRFDAPQWQPPVAPPERAPAPRPDTASRPAQPDPSRDRPSPPTFTRAAPAEPDPTAAWALGLGIAGLALLVLSFGTFFMLALPLSAASWVLAERARGRSERAQAGPNRQGQITAALWLGRIGVIAGVAAAVVFIALLASGFDFERFRDDLQRELDRRRQDDGGNVRTSVEGLRAVLGAWLSR